MKERILIVDDEIDVCEALKEILVHEGFQVDTAMNGEQASQLLGQVAYKVVLIDVRLEGSMSGISLIHHMIAAKLRPKIMIISATPIKSLLRILGEEGLTDAVDELLEKPVDLHPDRFVKVMNKVLKR